MSELGVLGGERLREPKALDDAVVVAHAAVDRRPRTGVLREALYRHAIGTHMLERDCAACAAERIAAVIKRSGAPLPDAVSRRLESLYRNPVPFTACGSCG